MLPGTSKNCTLGRVEVKLWSSTLEGEIDIIGTWERRACEGTHVYLVHGPCQMGTLHTLSHLIPLAILQDRHCYPH